LLLLCRQHLFALLLLLLRFLHCTAGPSLGMPGLGSGGGFGGNGGSGSSAAAAAAPKAGLPKKGMQLGKGKGASSILESLAKEEGVASLDEPARPTVAVGGAPVGTQVISGEFNLVKMMVQLSHRVIHALIHAEDDILQQLCAGGSSILRLCPCAAVHHLRRVCVYRH
jgi:hypothetical protein